LTASGCDSGYENLHSPQMVERTKTNNNNYYKYYNNKYYRIFMIFAVSDVPVTASRR